VLVETLVTARFFELLRRRMSIASELTLINGELFQKRGHA
jgi:hypothetical protein